MRATSAVTSPESMARERTRMLTVCQRESTKFSISSLAPKNISWVTVSRLFGIRSCSGSSSWKPRLMSFT